MHAVRLEHLDANPLSGRKSHVANVAHNALIALPDDLLAQPNTAIYGRFLGRKSLDLIAFGVITATAVGALALAGVALLSVSRAGSAKTPL
eukprot:CAMPEP_0183440098 /NCGR_PEP_ID=MMETSP0370-20130417/80283_1 /TAXON_ID=268820 /ORGANISM="Peridinium aciculiferum, Strain PAER-2" /LENGTH=90 /DNA_ID=CAMNT_0025628823 /DNA_START=213 /DNA_END=483 /DNA_ORIENTATION=-